MDGSWHETAAAAAGGGAHLPRLDVPALARIGTIGPERADLMLAGSAIFAAICALWPSRMLRVADRGLREGMLRQMRDAAYEQAGMKSRHRARRRCASR